MTFNETSPKLPPMNNSLGAYLHIPFCIQRCHYCDFATYAKDQIQANDDYVDHLLIEMEKRQAIFPQKTLSTIYFGGGTPSLLNPQQISRIIQNFKKLGYQFADDIEITMEVNPATLTQESCSGYKQAGVNRMSIGCQSFDDESLKNCNREHSAQQTIETIELVKKHLNNFSLDLLFSLPHQGLPQLEKDLEIFRSFQAPHISAYCLTLEAKHPMNQNRCSDDEQTEMFEMIRQQFLSDGLHRYEISNFAKPGFESRHNLLYWQDKDYWGLGLSAHSYRSSKQWGHRFWNPSSYSKYLQHIDQLSHSETVETSYLPKHFEILAKHESLTDFCHTSLRLSRGLELDRVHQKFGSQSAQCVSQRLASLKSNSLVVEAENAWVLTEKGLLLSNRVFSELLFSQEIDKI